MTNKVKYLEVVAEENPDQRVQRLYRAQGGPLIGWLLDECQRRGQTQVNMCAELGITYPYFQHLKSGLRPQTGLSQDCLEAFSKYLGVQPVVVKLLSGHIRMTDFLLPAASEEEALDRAWAEAADDSYLRALLPKGLSALPLQARKVVLAMYEECTGRDVFGSRRLPGIVHQLQRAALIHDEALASACS